MNTMTLTMALLMGFTGSLHCAGMCGPIMLVMPFQFLQGYKKWLGIFLYHLGRISTYAMLAFVLHSFRSLFQPQVQQYVSIALGSGLLLVGIISFIPNHKTQFSLPWTGYVKTQLGKFIGSPRLGTLFITGVLNGMLPCGLVYMALSASVTTSTTAHSVAFMFMFGIGTMPMLTAITVLKSKVAFLRKPHIKKLVPITMFAFGCLFMLRGMNLGIPYLSPRVEITQHAVKASCCERK